MSAREDFTNFKADYDIVPAVYNYEFCKDAIGDINVINGTCDEEVIEVVESGCVYLFINGIKICRYIIEYEGEIYYTPEYGSGGYIKEQFETEEGVSDFTEYIDEWVVGFLEDVAKACADSTSNVTTDDFFDISYIEECKTYEDLLSFPFEAPDTPRDYSGTVDQINIDGILHTLPSFKALKEGKIVFYDELKK